MIQRHAAPAAVPMERRQELIAAPYGAQCECHLSSTQWNYPLGQWLPTHSESIIALRSVPDNTAR